MVKYYLAQILEKPPTLPETPANPSTIQSITAIVFAIFGALAFLVIVIAGVQLIVSAGDPAKVAQAKRAIIYAAVGLAIAAGAATIVYFIFGRI